MTQHDDAKWVVVGIDGSQAAIDAARWAVEEALTLNVPLRLVHVIPPMQTGRPPAQTQGDIEPFESELEHAQAIIQNAGKPVQVETAILHGPPDRVLIEESREAAMICVGSVGRGRLARMPLGSTAAALANHAHCAVAIVRTAPGSQTENGWIAAVLNDEPDNDAVVHRAMAEARLRKTSVLLIDRRVDSWIRRYPDVTVHTIAENSRATRPIENHGESVQLVIVGSADADNVAQLTDYNCHPVLRYGNAPVLLIRQ
jgi:nucleotide-binding universal stress UspA family protein